MVFAKGWIEPGDEEDTDELTLVMKSSPSCSCVAVAEEEEVWIGMSAASG